MEAYKYKDFDGRWLAEIPQHWNYVPILKYLESLVDYRGKTPKKVESGIFLVTAKNIKNGIINYELSKEYIELDSYDDVMRRGKPEINDILFTTEAPLGEIALVDNTEIALAQRIIKFRPKPESFNSVYLKYFFQSVFFQQNLLSLATGSTALGIKSSKLCLLRSLKPTVPEQTQIANFLDNKTGQIDRLIAQKEKLLKLLAEKRTAIITRAVTKGLDPNMEMKDSGIDWLGAIPKHWEVWKTAHGFNKIGSGTTPKSDNPEYYNGEILWVTTSELREKPISDTKNKVTDLALCDYNLKYFSPGAVIIAMYGATIGRLGMLKNKATVNQACCVFDEPTRFNSMFLYYWLWMASVMSR